MNGNSGIVPTVDLATNNTYPYPVMYGNGGFGGNGGFLGGEGIWAFLLFALIFGNGGWGNNGGGFFGGVIICRCISSATSISLSQSV